MSPYEVAAALVLLTVVCLAIWIIQSWTAMHYEVAAVLAMLGIVWLAIWVSRGT